MNKMNVLKKRISAAIFASAIIISNAMCVLAATPQPTATARPRPGTSTATVTQTSQTASSTDDEEETTSVKKSSASDSENDSEKKVNVSTVAPVVETVAPMATVSEKKYTTKGGAFGWFLLSVLVNAALSFAIANRFYKMSKKDNHISAEIRALRRDVEERFASTVNGFYEQETDMTNQNDDYSSGADGIKMAQKPIEKDESAEEIFKKWEQDLADQRARKRAEIRASVSPRGMKDEEEAVQTKAYQPDRHSSADLYEEDYDDEYDDYEEEESKFEIFKSKAKEFITDVFPLKED